MITKSDFKFKRESLGFSNKDISELLNVKEESIEKWQQANARARVPVTVFDVLDNWCQSIDQCAEKVYLELLNTLLKSSETPERIFLCIYKRANWDYYAALLDNNDLLPNASAHRYLISRVAALLKDKHNIQVSMITMDHDSYQDFLHTKCVDDSTAMRAYWAATVGVAREMRTNRTTY